MRVIDVDADASAKVDDATIASTWLPFLQEHQQASLPDASTRTFRFGHPSHGWAEKTIAQTSIQCSTWFFGSGSRTRRREELRDPVVVAFAFARAFTVTLARAGPGIWKYAASDGQTMNFADSSARNLRYGNAGKGWIYKTSFSPASPAPRRTSVGTPRPVCRRPARSTARAHLRLRPRHRQPPPRPPRRPAGTSSPGTARR